MTASIMVRTWHVCNRRPDRAVSGIVLDEFESLGREQLFAIHSNSVLAIPQVLQGAESPGRRDETGDDRFEQFSASIYKRKTERRQSGSTEEST